MSRIWAGVDAGKGHHHCVVIDGQGQKLLSRRVANDEPDLLGLLGDVGDLATEVTWAIDLADGPAALLIAVLLAHGQQLLYIPGHIVHRASGSYRGEGKTDARDAAVIADQARMCRDLHPLRQGDEITIDLDILTTRRRDLVEDRTRLVNRLRGLLLGVFPALERALTITNRGPLLLLTGFQSPSALREIGEEHLTEWLQQHQVRHAATLAHSALEAAGRQHATLPGERLTCELVATLAREISALNTQIDEIDRRIAEQFQQHCQASIITSMPGIGTLLGAEFLAATGGDMAAFDSCDHLAGFAGLAPAPRDSGRISGNLHRPKRYLRGLQRVFYQSALISIRWSAESQRFYERKRSEGKRHNQAVLALARRRVNVLWALLRDNRPYDPHATAA